MLKLLRFLKAYKKESILGPLFKLLEASFELIIPIIMAQIIDIGISSGDSNYIMKKCLLMILMGIGGLVCSLTAQFFAAKAAVGFATGLRKSLFEYIQEFSFLELDKIGLSTLITRMTSDVNQIQTGVNLVIRLFLRSPFIVFGAMIMAFRINVKASMIFVITIPVLSFVIYGIMLISIPLYKKVQSGLDRVLLAVRENLSGVRVIRAINYEKEEINNFNNLNNELTKRQLLVGKISSLMNPVTYVIINISIVVIVYKGAIQVDRGIITRGEVVALVNYMSQILVELVKLATLIITVTKSVASGNRVQEIFEIKPSMIKCAGISDKETEGEELSKIYKIGFDNVGLVYGDSAEESLSDISFDIEKGEVVGIIGGTGAGKTSLINIISRYYDVTSGIVTLNDKNIKDYNLFSVRKQVAVVPQKSVLFRGTIRENMQLGKENATDEEIINALKIAKAYEFVEQKEGVLDYVIEQGGKNLSGGQKQRLAIARALVTDASVIILDDSMSALDYATDAALRKELRNIKDKIIIIVSQRVVSLKSTDRIIVMDDGRIVDIGKHDDLLHSCDIYQEIYNSQVKNDKE